MAISTTYGIAYFFFALFQCGNPSQILENKLAGRCQSATIQLGMGYTHAAVQALADWAFAILPVFIIWSANMDRRTKVSVGLILMLGAAGSTATLVRFKFESGLVSEDDFFFAAANIAITCTIEAGLGITAGSLATLKPLFRCCFYRVRETFSSTERRARYGQQKSAHSQTGRRAPANSFRPYGNTTTVGEATAKTQTTIIGNDRASSSSSGDDVSMKELVVRDQSLGDSSSSRNLPAGWKIQDDIPDPNRSWFRIEKTTDVEVTNETRSRHGDV
ncbi:MAG: hypothetical protein M1821_009908 [Bathelium mastoideum]|nr:MAG: hypothetical protein M1821_009908 [Bathelium mastoideum]